MKNKVWSIAWPLILILLGFWFLPEVMVIYVLIGMGVKIGQIANSKHGGEAVFKSAFGYIVEAYYTLTWPRYFKGEGYKGVAKVVGGCLLVVTLVSGLLYYLGSTSIVPDAVTQGYSSVISESGHPLPTKVKEEIGQRIEEGFSYSDLLWARKQILESCGYDMQPEPRMDQFKTTLIIGIYSLDPSYSSGIIAARNARYNLNCSVKETTD